MTSGRSTNKISSSDSGMDKYKLATLVNLYMENIVKFQGTPLSIVSNIDPRFTSRVWKEFQIGMTTKLMFSNAFYPRTNGQSLKMIQVVKDLLRSCLLDWQSSCEDYLPLVEFAHNNSYQSTISMTHLKVLYKRPCRSPSC